VEDSVDMQRVVAEAVDASGGLDVVVTNAGITAPDYGLRGRAATCTGDVLVRCQSVEAG